MSHGKAQSPSPSGFKARAPGDVPVDLSLIMGLRPGRDGDGFVEGLIRMFVEDMTSRLSAMSTSLVEGDRAGVRRDAHALKGSSAQFGARHLMELCEELEARAQRGSDSRAWAALRLLVEEAGQVRRALCSRLTRTD